MAPRETPGGVRRALLIGINAYSDKPLRGCVGDAQAMATLLHERFGFDAAEITLLLDGQASLERVNREMARLLEVTQSGDTVCFFYAGHGTVFEQSDGSEATGLGTTFCLQENPREDLYDDDFGEWLDTLAKRTENVVIIADCCHSGTITRDGTDSAVASPLVRRTSAPAPDVRPTRRRAGPRRSITTVASSAHTLIAACRDDQLASETFLDETRTATSGALSLVLCRELRAAKDGDTWRDIFERVAPQVNALARKEDGYQDPQIEGRSDRVIFGLEEFAPVSPFRITERARVNVLLNAGALQGVTRGTVFVVYPEGSKAGDDNPSLGRVQVTQVRGTTSRARILGEAAEGAITAGTRAVSSATDSFAMALAIENTNVRSALNGRVTLTILRRGADDVFAPIDAAADGSRPSFDSGERIALRITNASSMPVFANLFYFSPRGTISQLSKGNANLVPPGGSLDIGTADRGKLTLRWNGESAVASFKLFASTTQVDLGYLERLGEAARESAGMPLATSDDWTTVTAAVTLNGSATLASDTPVDVSGATVTARGLRGTLVPVPVRAAEATRGSEDPLAAALAAEGLVPQQSFMLTDATADAEGSRSADAPPTIELQVPDAGEGMAQLAMSRDADGLVHWHFATALDEAPPTRDGSVPQLRTRTFVIPAESVAVEGERSLLGVIGKKLIDVYLFPIGKAVAGTVIGMYAHVIELRRTPYRVRSFTPADYASRERATVIEGDAWRTLSAGRALLMIHGTNSSSHSAFSALPREYVEALHAQYEGRVFAFDHPTLTHTPKENIETFLAAMPEGTTLDVDIICHSRGGLVSRVLAERQDQVLVAGRTVRVHKVVFVGSPNAGTRLCEEDFITDYLDTLTNLLSAYPLPGAADIVAGIVMLAKIGAAGLYSALTGIHSMQPEGLFGTWLNAGTRAEQTRYFALTSNFKPTDLALARLATYVLAGRVFKGARNDLVVPTDGVFAANGSSAFPITDMVAFDGTDGIPHTGFFGDARATTQIARWLAT